MSAADMPLKASCCPYIARYLHSFSSLTKVYIADKIRKRQQTRRGLTADVVLDELDEIILDIIGE